MLLTFKLADTYSVEKQVDTCTWIPARGYLHAYGIGFRQNKKGEIGVRFVLKYLSKNNLTEI